jgi:hypothetical protein
MKSDKLSSEHPLNRLVALNTSEGGTSKEVSYGTNIFDKDGNLLFLVKNVRKDTVALYLPNTTVEKTQDVFSDTPERVIQDKNGNSAARLKNVTSNEVTREFYNKVVSLVTLAKQNKRVKRPLDDIFNEAVTQ